MDIDKFWNNLLETVDPDNNDFIDNYLNFGSYTLNNFSDSHISKHHSFNLLHHNARSILTEGRLDEYNIMLNEISNPFHLLAFTETWLKSDNVNLINFEGYDSYHSIRQTNNDNNIKQNGGGISVFIKEGIEYKIRNDLNVVLPYVETLFVEVKFANKTYMIGIIYRVPNTNVELFIDKVNELIEPIQNKFELIITGDFNICLLKDNIQANNFQNCMMSNNLIPTILEATRVSNVNRNGEEALTETLIDNFLINTQGIALCKSGLIQSSITDHYPIFLSILCSSSSPNNDYHTIKYRTIDNISTCKFKQELNATFLNTLSNIDDAPKAFGIFHARFQTLYDKYFPIKYKTLTTKSLLKPWVTNALVNKIKIKDNLCIFAKKGKVEKKVYKDFRNILNKQLKNAKALYHYKKFHDNNGNIKKTWEIININIKKRTNNRNIELFENQIKIHNSHVPNKFINFFSTTAEKSVLEMPDSNIDPKSYLTKRQINTFFCSPIQNKEIEDAILSLKDNGCGLYNFSSSLLIDVKTDISPTLANIFNLCTDQGYFPEELKIGCITPIYKKDDKTNVSNYRPVCSLSPFSKIFERVIYLRMLTFIEKYELFSRTQFGFRQNLSTESALQKLIDYVHNGLTRKHNVGAVFMDLSKAFDIMNHDLLEVKLEHYGFRGTFLKFLMSFIRNRKYFVNVNGMNSDTKTLNIGVGQGSTLGPMFFLLFVNDMKECSLLIEFIQFADDTTILFSCKDFLELQSILESEIINVTQWLVANKLLLNVSKTQLMMFSFKKNNPKLSIRVNNSVIEEIPETNFLGVQLDNKLAWKTHIAYICNKVSKSLAILRLVKSIFPKKILKMIYMSLFYTYLSYCNLIWGSAAQTVIEPLFLLQKKAVRVITHSKYLEHTGPLFDKLKLLTVYQVYEYNCLLFVYKCIKCNYFSEFKQRILINFDVHNHNTRKKTLRVSTIARLDICKRSFLYFGINAWNHLDSELKFINSIGYFKKKVKYHILSL